jgi:hypothetical protein
MKSGNEMQLTTMIKQDENESMQDDLPTYIGPKAHGDQMLWMPGEIVQPMQLADDVIKVSSPMLNYIIQQRKLKHILIMRINRHIIMK